MMHDLNLTVQNLGSKRVADIRFNFSPKIEIHLFHSGGEWDRAPYELEDEWFLDVEVSDVERDNHIGNYILISTMLLPAIKIREFGKFLSELEDPKDNGDSSPSRKWKFSFLHQEKLVEHSVIWEPQMSSEDMGTLFFENISFMFMGETGDFRKLGSIILEHIVSDM